MSTQTEKLIYKYPGFKPTNFVSNPIESKGLDCSNGKRMSRHLEREGNGVIIVEDGIVDEDAAIQSEACNAGLVNILRMQELRYGTIQNAIKHNEAKQTFGNVSKVPLSVAEQQEFIANSEKEIDALCKKLGISKEDLLKSTADTLAKLFADKQASEAAAAAAAAAAVQEASQAAAAPASTEEGGKK